MFLDAILADVEERVQRLIPVISFLREEAGRMGPVRSLQAALQQKGWGIIAECKQKSPSKGWLTHSYDPAAQSRHYQQNGAAAVSVLTEPHYFAGDLSHLAAVRREICLPVLRKDFVRHPVQLFEARTYGADAALLIVRILDDAELRDLYATAKDIGLEVLLEVHSPQELERALALNPGLIGVNNRDLTTFETRLEFSQEMARQLPPHVVRVSESGISSGEDLERVRSWGYQGALIGESLMRNANLLREWTYDDAH